MRLKSIIDIFRPFQDDIAVSEESARLIDTFIISSLTAIFTMVSFSLITILENNFLTSIFNITASTCAVINMIIFKRYKNYFVACNMLFFIASTLLFCHQLIAVSPYPHNYFWGCLVPVFAAILAGKKSSFIWTIVVAVLFSISYLINISTTHSADGLYIDPSAYPIHFLAGLNLSIIGGFVIASFVVREVDEKRKKIDRAYYRNQLLLNIVTHDVSNPLVVLQTSLGAFNDTDLDEKGKKHIERMRRSVEYLGDVIRNVRQTNAIHSGKIELDIRPIKLSDVLEKVFFLFEEKLAAKELSIKLSDPHAEIYVYADQIALGQSVINNLISNAIKFSHRGGVIEITTQKVEEFILLKLTDHGVGMRQEQVERIFLPYTSTTRRGTDNEEGTGFGMPIVKALVERFGGEVIITSQENVGTSVTLKLRAA